MRQLIIIMMLSMGMTAHSQDAANETIQFPDGLVVTNPSDLIDYDGFTLLTREVSEHRQGRLISKSEFVDMMRDPDTIVLDTRSQEAFDFGHIDGAVHLNFSDFTDDKLAKVVGDKNRRILIYCNNNYADNVAPVPLKRVQLALNIPTFINLYGYGYENIYELSDTISIHDPDLALVPSAQ